MSKSVEAPGGCVAAVRAAVGGRADSPAILSEGAELGWNGALDSAGRIAGALRSLGVGPGDRVAILSANDDLFVRLYLAIPWIGAVPTPLNCRWSAAENAFALADCRPSLMIVGKGFEQAAQDAIARSGLSIPVVSSGTLLPGWVPSSEFANHAPVPAEAVDGDALWGIFYTGGTTGRAKGVMLSNANIVVNSQTPRTLGVFPDGCRSLIVAPLFHLAGASALMSTMLAGGAAVVAPGFHPAETPRLIADKGVTDVFLVPVMIRMMLDDPGFDPGLLSGVRRILYGASPMSEPLLDRITAAAPHAEFYQAYGMTETSAAATLLTPDMHRGESRRAGKHRSAGRALPGTDVRVAGPDGRPTAVGEVGEIWVRGPGVMLGYWEQPEVTAAALVDGWMHTGDGGYLDETGVLFVVDRMKDMIVSGGENVYSAEVEAVLDSHPAVAQCAVIAVPDARWGERVHAVIVFHPDMDASEEELGAHCRESIAAYKCPRSYEFLSALPLSAAGKVLKAELRARHWAGQSSNVS